MFAAMCENSDFFRERANGFVMLAPILRIQNLRSPRIQKIKNDTKIVKAAQAIGPEIMTTANASDPVKGALTNSWMGEALTSLVLKEVSDEDPSLINVEGFSNYSKFYPSGSCVQQFDHFRQMILTGEFKKY